MSAVFLQFAVEGLDAARAVLDRAADPRRLAELPVMVGGLVEAQTRRRFQTRVAPDGSPWPAWSPAYAGSRHRGQSLLVAEGHLRDSIAWEVQGDQVSVGSNIVYAAIHNFGGEAGRGSQIPQRQYLGLSEADETELNAELTTWIAGVLQ